MFVEECGTHTSLAAVYGYCPKGERLGLWVARNRGKNTTLLAGEHELGRDGPISGGEWLDHRRGLRGLSLEQVLLPELQEEGQVVLMESLPAHKPK